MCTSLTGQHGGEGVLYILTVNLNIRGSENYIISLNTVYEMYFYLDFNIILIFFFRIF